MYAVCRLRCCHFFLACTVFGILLADNSLISRVLPRLDLHLVHKIPPTMLLMSRILYLSENIPVSERIRAVLEALPGEAVATTSCRMCDGDVKWAAIYCRNKSLTLLHPAACVAKIWHATKDKEEKRECEKARTRSQDGAGKWCPPQ